MEFILKKAAKVFHYKFSWSHLNTSLLLLLFSIVVSKSLISLMVLYRFKRFISVKDLFLTYSTDLAIWLIVALSAFGATNLFLSYIRRFDYLLKQLTIFVLPFNKVKHPSFSPLYTGLKILRPVVYMPVLLFPLTAILLAGFYILCSYVFFEWGAFVEPQHMEALKMHGGGREEFFFYFYRWQTLFFSSCFLFLFWIAYKVTDSIRQMRSKIVLLVPLLLIILFAFAAWIPLSSPEGLSPAVFSPVVSLSKSKVNNSAGVEDKLLESINKNDFYMESGRPVAPAYLKFKGVAQGMNILFVVLESVRKQNLNLYGYHRNTMPFLNSITQSQGMVFENAYVNQPRSCKTLASILLGVYPDPRLRAVSWRHFEIRNRDNLVKKFLDDGYKFYFGSAQSDYGSDGFFPFLMKLTEGRIHRAMSRETLPWTGSYERALAADFLKWSQKENGRFFGVLWTKLAHMPYDSPTIKFEEKSVLDRYDNSLAHLDIVIQDVVTGLKKQGKLKNTLIVLFGDHGEALGEKLDMGHGNFLYEHSLRVPFLIYHPHIFNGKITLNQRFQMKDLPSTLLYLMGKPSHLRQSENIFTKSAQDPIYLSNVYTDYKLGLIYDHYKFVYRPKYNLSYLFHLQEDPNEDTNIVGRLSSAELQALRQKTLTWYKYQIEYLENEIFN